MKSTKRRRRRREGKSDVDSFVGRTKVAKIKSNRTHGSEEYEKKSFDLRTKRKFLSFSILCFAFTNLSIQFGHFQFRHAKFTKITFLSRGEKNERRERKHGRFARWNRFWGETESVCTVFICEIHRKLIIVSRESEIYLTSRIQTKLKKVFLLFHLQFQRILLHCCCTLHRIRFRSFFRSHRD